MTFVFISKGKTDIIKVIQYTLLKEIYEQKIFNLGFGDYNVENDKIQDKIDSNNNDAYKVINTVLSTIPLFFEKHRNDYLYVSGSDNDNEFIKHCIIRCKKNCTTHCKNINRRIRLYTKYIDENYLILFIDYQFFGGTKNDLGDIIFENYLRNSKYESILILNKNTTFTL